MNYYQTGLTWTGTGTVGRIQLPLQDAADTFKANMAAWYRRKCAACQWFEDGRCKKGNQPGCGCGKKGAK